MSTRYKFHADVGICFISFATIGWTDVFTRMAYKHIFVESLRHCQQHNGLELYAWCLMTSHVHLVARAREGHRMADILRDLKKFTSKQIIKTREENPQESRREWLLAIFHNAGSFNANNTTYEFWRQDNNPIELYTPHVMKQKINYVNDKR